MNSTTEIDELISKMTGEKILRHTCQLLVKDENGKLKPHGSAVFVIVAGIHFLITASHVTEHWSDQNQLYIRIGKNNYVSLVGELRETDLSIDEKIDLSYVKIDERIIPDLKKPYLFLPVSKIRDHKLLNGAANYCVMGYPEKSLANIDDKIEPVAQAYYLSPSSEKVYEHYKFDPNMFYMLDMKGKGTNIKTGEVAKTGTHFYGISGCGLWLMIIDSDGKNHSIDYRLIGIMTEFRNTKFLSLIGIRIKLFLDAMTTLEKIELFQKAV
ncbi:hypothetical protein G4D82_14135 [Flavobacterium sp. CYK-4]|uniref:hypothetical protein n=1 Tax=Flavobacterium lotistagni TaxID=2709660 RepID=UPI00140B9EED|nr:hypothetical protein [Flavobacterium lotistagni]NHM08364.1 hypothetical protein [Flavobacterium lotistagni]